MKWERSNNTITLKKQSVSFVFDINTGKLTKALKNQKEHVLNGIVIDAGVNNQYARNTMAFDCLDEKRTWELPLIAPNQTDIGVFNGFEEREGTLEGVYSTPFIEIRQCYDISGDTLRVRAKIKNISEQNIIINGTAFLTYKSGLEDYIEFPTNVPSESFAANTFRPYESVISCGLVGSMAHIANTKSDSHINILFLDHIEKWSQGAFITNQDLCSAYIAATECQLAPLESYECGALYVQPLDSEDAYLSIRRHFDSLGLHPATDGLREGILYSCHPHGTMDNNFQRPKDLYEYAKELKDIKSMGIDHIWVLPVFEHLDRGVYHPTDQKIIDARYGGDEAVRHFVDEAHKLNMTVLFDYVPHGPAHEDSLAQEKGHWCSKRRDLNNQDEWNCVSFDMTNPDYLRYTRDMVNNHVNRFDIDGARIDCAMGGLSNWAPLQGHRPSASNLQGGVLISKAIKDGFLEMGKKAFILPENFNPVPAYYPVTDVFYGMNLYRVLVSLEEQKLSPFEFARRLTRFLEIEHKAMPENLKKLRFLGNHDTVSWVWQKRRAYEVYGEGMAKALFALMALIDGVPMVYQGDEDPAMAGKQGPILREFFKILYADRKKWVGEGTQIQYLDTKKGVMAFIRTLWDDESNKAINRLVLVSLSDNAESVTLPELSHAVPCLDHSAPNGGTITIAPYAYQIFEIAE